MLSIRTFPRAQHFISFPIRFGTHATFTMIPQHSIHMHMDPREEGPVRVSKLFGIGRYSIKKERPEKGDTADNTMGGGA